MARPFLDEAQVAQVRAKLVAASLALYREKGYDAVSLREVAAKVGISHVTPYRYFPSKEDMVSAVRAEVWGQFGAYLSQATQTATDERDRLRRMFAAFVSFAVDNPQDYRLIFSLRQPPHDDFPVLRDARLRVMNQVIGLVRQAVEAGAVQGDPLLLAHLGWSALHGLITLHVSGQLSLGYALQDLLQPVLDMLLPPNDAVPASSGE